MAIKLTFSNILQLFAALAPLLLGFFLVMSSLFNQSLKGMVYLAGVLMASIINVFLMNLIKSPMSKETSGTVSCNLVELPYHLSV